MLTKYEEKLIGINEMMVSLGEEIVDANEAILNAFIASDYSSFKETKISLDSVKKDAAIIDNQIVTVLALFSPEACDLKSMISYLKITDAYVRASSNTKSFLKNFPSKMDGELKLDIIMPNVVLLQKSTTNALKFAVAMLSEEDKSKAKDLCMEANMEEGKSDDLYSIIEKDLFVEMLNAKELSQEYFEMLSLIRKIEKIGDRAADIANLQFDSCHNS